MNTREVAGHSTFAMVEKWEQDKVEYVQRKTGLLEPKRVDLWKYVDPDDIAEDHTPNLMVANGLDVLTDLLVGISTTVSLSAANKVALGVGSGVTAATAADTNLTTQSWWQIADSAPAQTTVTTTHDSVSITATVGTANANVAWQEWGVAVATTGTLVSAATLAGTGTAVLFNHKVTSLGTKTSTATWALTVTLTWS